MRKTIPLTGSSTVVASDPGLEKFRASLNRVWEKTLASGKVRILNAGSDIQNDRGSTSPKTAPEPAPANTSSAPPPRRAPPPRPAFKRPTALQK